MITRKTYTKYSLLLALACVGAVGAGSAIAPAQASASDALTMQMDVGAQGPEVTILQRYLAGNPNIYPQGIVSGYYGALTEAAVARFQVAHGLPAVGRVGPRTLAMLNPLIAGGGGSVGDIYAPSVSNLHMNRTSTGFTVSWNTSEPTYGSIHYSLLPITQWETTRAHEEPQISGTLLSDVDLGTSHSLSVTGLNASDTYYLTTESRDAAGNLSVTLSSALRP